MDLDAIEARLKAALTTVKGASIGVAADMATAMAGGPIAVLPAIFVIPLEEDAESIGGASTNHETHTPGFGVVHVISNKRDARGKASLADLKTCRAELKTALVGYVPDPANGEPVHFKGGRLLNMDSERRMWWIDRFAVKTFYWSN